MGYPRKEIFLEPRRNHLNVIVTNNGRRSTQDSKKFDNILDAQGYMYDYIKQTIFH